MSVHMLNDDDAINDVNPFVTHDFSLPGGVRQTGGFDDFQEVTPSTGVPDAGKSVFCETGLCVSEKKALRLERGVHPRRRIDRGFTCGEKKEMVKVGVSNRSIPWGWIFITVLVIVLALLYVKR